MPNKTETPILDTLESALNDKKRDMGKSPNSSVFKFDPDKERSMRERLDTLSKVASDEAQRFIDEVLQIIAGTTLVTLLATPEKTTDRD